VGRHRPQRPCRACAGPAQWAQAADYWRRDTKRQQAQVV